MKNAKLLLAVFACILTFSACKKNDSGSSNSANLPKTYTEDITSSSYGNSVTTYNLSYDGNNRLTSLVQANAPGNKFVYKYNTNNTYTLDLYYSNVLSIHEIFFINGNSLVDSTYQYDDTQDGTTEKYLYNSAGQLTRLSEYDYTKTGGSVLNNVHTYEYDANGNQTKDMDYFDTQTFTYYTDLENSLSIGQTYFPKGKYLIKTLTLDSGGSIVTVNYTYTFDSQHRLVTDKEVSSDGDIVIKTYTY